MEKQVRGSQKAENVLDGSISAFFPLCLRQSIPIWLHRMWPLVTATGHSNLGDLLQKARARCSILWVWLYQVTNRLSYTNWHELNGLFQGLAQRPPNAHSHFRHVTVDLHQNIDLSFAPKKLLCGRSLNKGETKCPWITLLTQCLAQVCFGST